MSTTWNVPEFNQAWPPLPSRPNHWNGASESYPPGAMHDLPYVYPLQTFHQPSSYPYRPSAVLASGPEWGPDHPQLDCQSLVQRVQGLEERLELLEQDNRRAKERLQNFDVILNTVTGVNNTLCDQLNISQGDLKKYDEVDKRTRAIHSELDKIFDRIDPVLTALIKIARECSPTAVPEYEEDFDAFLECHTEEAE